MATDPVHIDKWIINKIAVGDQAAFRVLVEAYNPVIYAFAGNYLKTKELIEEVVSDVFMQIWVARETLPEINNLGKYLFVISRNKSLNALKKEIKQQSVSQVWSENAQEDEMQERLIKEKALDLIDLAVSRLPLQQRKVWEMSRRQRMTYPQIAAEMNISRETVKSYLQAANEAIKRFVISEFDISLSMLIIFLKYFHK